MSTTQTMLVTAAAAVALLLSMAAPVEAQDDAWTAADSGSLGVALPDSWCLADAGSLGVPDPPAACS